MNPDQTYYDKETKIWHGPTIEPRYSLDDSIGSVVLEALRKYPDHVSQICHPTGNQFSNRQMAEMSCRVAVHFGRLKLQQTEVVGICAANSDYVAPIFFGAMFSGLCLSTTDPSTNVKGLKHIYSVTKPRVMFCDGDIYEKVQQALKECGLAETVIYTVRNHIEGVPNVMEFLDEKNAVEDFRVPPLKHGGRQDAFYLCTSGSTNLPKAVRLSHYAILNRTTSNEQFKGQKMLIFSSLYWFLGIVSLIQCAVNSSIRCVSENPFTPSDFYDIVKQHRISIVAASPSHIPLCLACPETLAASDLSSIRIMIVTGKSLPYTLVEKFKKYAENCLFPIFYGMTELCGGVTHGLVDPSNTVGYLGPNTEIKILNDRAEHLGPNEIGEIYIRTKFASSGYYCNPEANRKTFLEDGWVRSGDMGYFNDEEQLFIVDRRQDIMKYNNFHFSPTAIEQVICEISDVAEVCVVGIPDFIYDRLPAAAVIRRRGANITEAEICEYVANRMQHFENLHGGVYFFESLPLTASGKVIRKEVTEMCSKLRKMSNL